MMTTFTATRTQESYPAEDYVSVLDFAHVYGQAVTDRVRAFIFDRASTLAGLSVGLVDRREHARHVDAVTDVIHGDGAATYHFPVTLTYESGHTLTGGLLVTIMRDVDGSFYVDHLSIHT